MYRNSILPLLLLGLLTLGCGDFSDQPGEPRMISEPASIEGELQEYRGPFDPKLIAPELNAFTSEQDLFATCPKEWTEFNSLPLSVIFFSSLVEHTDIFRVIDGDTLYEKERWILNTKGLPVNFLKRGNMHSIYYYDDAGRRTLELKPVLNELSNQYAAEDSTVELRYRYDDRGRLQTRYEVLRSEKFIELVSLEVFNYYFDLSEGDTTIVVRAHNLYARTYYAMTMQQWEFNADRLLLQNFGAIGEGDYGQVIGAKVEYTTVGDQSLEAGRRTHNNRIEDYKLQTYRYDQQGRKIEDLYFDIDPNGSRDGTRYAFEYSGDTTFEKEYLISSTMDTTILRLDKKTIYKNDDLVEEQLEAFSHNGSILITKSYDYTYDEKGNWSLIKQKSIWEDRLTMEQQNTGPIDAWMAEEEEESEESDEIEVDRDYYMRELVYDTAKVEYVMKLDVAPDEFIQEAVDSILQVNRNKEINFYFPVTPQD